MKIVRPLKHSSYRNRLSIRRGAKNEFFDIRGRRGDVRGRVPRGTAAELSEGSRGGKGRAGSGDTVIHSLDPGNGVRLGLVTRNRRGLGKRNAAKFIQI
eukprot:16381405-Heterocapsa_arctica.AAC.1